MLRPLPASFYVFICCAFHSQQLHFSSSWHVPSSSSLHRAERHAIWAKPTFLNAQICCQFITDSKRATSHYTHRHIDKNTDSTKKSKREQINLLQPAVCAFMCSTSFYCNSQKHETVCEPQEERGKKRNTPSDLLPQEYMGAKTIQFYTTIWSNTDKPRQKTALKNVDKRCC